MKAIISKNPRDSFSFSKRYFQWKKKTLVAEEDHDHQQQQEEETFKFTKSSSKSEAKVQNLPMRSLSLGSATKRKLSFTAVSKVRAALTRARTQSSSSGLGTKVVGTLFGHRRGHVHIAFQDESKLTPPFLVELATPTSILVKEMASGLVRIALECDKKTAPKKGCNNNSPKLLEESMWRTYCNGKKCGYAMRRECGVEEWKVLNAVGPISMGAGVIPGRVESDGEMMYMRAKFERVVGSRDSEAFYMMNPDGNGGPEMSIYLLRV